MLNKKEIKKILKKNLSYLILIFVLLFVFLLNKQEEIIENDTFLPTEESESNLQYYQVDRVVDGDTVRVFVNGKSTSVRLIGINSPEIVHPDKNVECMGAEASNKAKELLSGKRIMLEKDSSQGNKDDYGRLLRYVFLEDGTNFNEWMISEGYAYEFTYNRSYKYQTQFKQAEDEAKDNKKGLWSPESCK